MNTFERRIINELGNVIDIKVEDDQRGVTVTATGPDSQVEHTWTSLEAKTMMKLISAALDTRPSSDERYPLKRSF